MNKSEVVRMRITPEDKALLKEDAMCMSSTISEYMEYRIFAKEIPPDREIAISVLKSYTRQRKTEADLPDYDANKLLDAILYWIEKL